MRKKPFAWSYSSLTSFETCPRKHYHTNVAKDYTEPPSDAMVWGQKVHKALEDRIGKGKRLRDGMDKYEKLAVRFDDMREKGVTVIAEQKVCLTEDLQPTEFFAKDAWVRGIFDVVAIQGKTAEITDWKTGKRKPDNAQLELFAALAFSTYDVEKVSTKFVWLKEKSVDKDSFIASDQTAIWEEYMPRVDRFKDSYDSNDWPERPSGLCRGYCPVRDCSYWEERR